MRSAHDCLDPSVAWFDATRYEPAARLPLAGWCHELDRRASAWALLQDPAQARAAEQCWQAIWDAPLSFDPASLAAGPRTQPYATLREAPSGRDSEVALVVDLAGNHELIENEFAHWLERTQGTLREQTRLVSGRDLATWHLTRLLAFVDVAAALRMHDHPLAHPDMARVVFGSRTYGRLADRAMQLWEHVRSAAFLAALRLQAGAEASGLRVVPPAKPAGS